MLLWTIFLALLSFTVAWALPTADCSDNCLSLPTCNNVEDIVPLETFPPETTAMETSGRLERKISRGDADFQKFVQLQGDGLVIVNEEETNTWCGNETRSCVNCQNGQPAATDDRENVDQCSDRLMSARLHSHLKLLQRLASREWPNRRVRVLEAWEEPTAADTSGIHPAYSLHYEGRSARLDVSVQVPSRAPAVPDSSEDPQLVAQLGALAVCAGFDHVSHDITDSSNYLTVSVRKQKGTHGRITTFPSGATFVEVDIPRGHKTDYQSSDDRSPLFDSDGRSQHQLSSHYQVRDFLSHHPVTNQPYRYFRLRPELIYCLEIVHTAVKDDIQIASGYRTVPENTNKPSNETDNRMHTVGRGLQVKTTSSLILPVDLATAIAEECGTYFVTKGQHLGIILLSEGVYFDIRKEFFASTALGVDMPSQEFHKQMSEALLTADRRIRHIKPCDGPSPSIQSSSYKYNTIPSQYKGVDPCPMNGHSSDYCLQTELCRKRWTETVWETVKLKHFSQTSTEMQLAIRKCLEPCAQCTEGETWETKVAGCNRFIHWAPLQLTVDSQQQTNVDSTFYAPNNKAMKEKACNASQKCIAHTEMFSIIAPVIEATCYPTNTSLDNEPLFGMPHNPTPLYDLMQETFAMHASGNTTVWITSTEDLAALIDVFKALLVHNTEVEKITVRYLESGLEEATVLRFLENVISHWTYISCKSTSRNHATPYQVEAFKE